MFLSFDLIDYLLLCSSVIHSLKHCLSELTKTKTETKTNNYNETADKTITKTKTKINLKLKKTLDCTGISDVFCTLVSLMID